MAIGGGGLLLLGIDIIDIERMAKAAQRTPHLLERVFTSRELQDCLGKKNPYPSLAARFAAKEALRKLDPCFIRGIRFQEVEVVKSPEGRPELVLHGQAREKAREARIEGFSLSLSHSKEQAIAALIAEKG
jgi:holo-[acyl-carrier protein] synthase